MAALAPSVRQPFAALDNPRLQHLASAKNRQIGKSSPLGFKSDLLSKPTANSSTKRAFAASTLDDADSENVDPSIFSSPSKKAKNCNFDKPVKSFTFSLAPAKSMPPPPTVPSRLSTPLRGPSSLPRTPLTAPAGRSPKRKTANIGKSRRTSAPFTRIDPPFSTRNAAGGALPFSLDAALNGTLSTARSKPNAGSTIQESMPSNWFFEIHEDTPEEEASNLMEHSTLTLDLSSDEESSKKQQSDLGKENVAPEGYDAPAASRPISSVGDAILLNNDRQMPTKKTDLIRKKIVTVDDMDDGQRSPLSDLETVPFFAPGLDKDAHVIVDAVESSPSASEQENEANSTRTQILPSPEATLPKVISMASSPLVNQLSNEEASTFVVWEDSPAPEPSSKDSNPMSVNTSRGKYAVLNENTAPATCL
ncbi:hypothetical protein K431DRAFT_232939 [Polychaeton citri CBS 116435]|uniref:Thymidylate kinase n=1 Tax=Polychaeton citri CBS 116435 TaxID=1314669 RepID=A0A9P4Q2Y9_9PEZI|nr:hypothetical protein K431DRAFT_232939 [Polychaeton citri CBS 116435]